MAKSVDTIPISKLASSIQPSATLAAAAKARQLKAEGIHVFDFSLGEPVGAERDSRVFRGAAPARDHLTHELIVGQIAVDGVS